MKKILVSFSGGLDSTYLIYKNLKKGHQVTGVYITIENNIDKVKMETQQINKLQKLFEEEFPNLFTLKMGMKVDAPTSGDLILKQILIWLFSLLYQDSSNYDEVQIGAVMNDDMVSYLNDINKTWKSFKFLNPKHPNLKFPLSKTSKYVIVESLPEKYKSLVVHCEEPIISKDSKSFKQCGKCEPCKRYKYNIDSWGITGYGQITKSKKAITKTT